MYSNRLIGLQNYYTFLTYDTPTYLAGAISLAYSF